MPSFDSLLDLLPEHVAAVVERPASIPAIAGKAKTKAAQTPGMVRADLGQIVGVNPQQELLYGPPVGLEPLRQALADLYTSTYTLAGVDGLDQGLEAANIAITTGAAEGLSLLFRAFAYQKTVGIPRGYWGNYINGVTLAQGSTTVVDYFDQDGALNVDGLSQQIRAEGIGILVANFPSNPTGAVLSPDEAAKLGALARDTDVLIIADEVYSRLRFDGQKPVSLLPYAPERTVVVSSASKEYLLPGARVGWVVSTRKDLSDKMLRKLIRANTASPNVPGQELVLALVQQELGEIQAGGSPQQIQGIRQALGQRKDALLAVLAKHGMDPVGRPNHAANGTIFLMASLPSWWTGSDLEFAHHVIDSGHFSVIHGAAFGLPGAVRFAFGSMPLDDIKALNEHLTKLASGS